MALSKRPHQEFLAARLRGQERNPNTSAVGASYDTARDMVAVELNTGVRFEIPRRLLEGLQSATSEQLQGVQILGPGTAIAWDEPDIGFTVEGLLRGMFGTKKWMSEMGRAGGSVKSERKTQAARRNGAKGGRPKQKMEIGTLTVDTTSMGIPGLAGRSPQGT